MPPINPKITKSGVKAREMALEGVEKVYEAVSATLGPRSANVAIARPFGRPAVVHDGVTVAKEVLPLENQFENVGAELAVEAADKTNAIGDGTTTATVLMRNIAKGAHQLIAAGGKPMAVREGIEAATAAIGLAVDHVAIPIKKVEDVRRIATVSAQNEQIGNMVAEAYKELGREGIMSVEESRGTDTFLEIKTGMEFDRGWRSPYFVTDANLGEAAVDNPYILVTDYSLRSIEQFAPLMEKLAGEGVKDIVIIANEVDGEALAFLVVNHVKGNLKVLAVQAPSFGDKRTEILRDIALVVGASFTGEGTGLGLEGLTKADLGRAARVSSTKDTTLIVDGAGPDEDVAKRAEQLKTQADNADTSEFDREKLMERYAKLKSGVAVLTIGAKSESEIKERKERAIDAVSAAKAALDGGIVPGGGMALMSARQVALVELIKYKRYKAERDWANGVDIVFDACRTPFDKLLSNAGFDPGEIWAQLQAEPKGSGFDVVSGKITDMVKAGIIDPALVVKTAHENASSNAVMLATTNVIIIEKTSNKRGN